MRHNICVGYRNMIVLSELKEKKMIIFFRAQCVSGHCSKYVSLPSKPFLEMRSNSSKLYQGNDET